MCLKGASRSSLEFCQDGGYCPRHVDWGTQHDERLLRPANRDCFFSPIWKVVGSMGMLLITLVLPGLLYRPMLARRVSRRSRACWSRVGHWLRQVGVIHIGCSYPGGSAKSSAVAPIFSPIAAANRTGLSGHRCRTPFDCGMVTCSPSTWKVIDVAWMSCSHQWCNCRLNMLSVCFFTLSFSHVWSGRRGGKGPSQAPRHHQTSRGERFMICGCLPEDQGVSCLLREGCCVCFPGVCSVPVPSS